MSAEQKASLGNLTVSSESGVCLEDCSIDCSHLLTIQCYGAAHRVNFEVDDYRARREFYRNRDALLRSRGIRVERVDAQRILAP